MRTPSGWRVDSLDGTRLTLRDSLSLADAAGVSGVTENVRPDTEDRAKRGTWLAMSEFSAHRQARRGRVEWRGGRDSNPVHSAEVIT
jgi:hypothetical protein